MAAMDLLEKLLVNSPLFTALHREVALPRMLALARLPIDGPLLELGCGQGATTEGLARRLPGVAITAVDLDPAQVERARARLGSRASVERGDMTALPHPDASFGTVVEMNALHHVREWPDALREIHRVLAPGGQLLLHDYTRAFALGAFAGGARQPGVFTAVGLAEGLLAAGFTGVVMHGTWTVVARAVKPDR